MYNNNRRNFIRIRDGKLMERNIIDKVALIPSYGKKGMGILHPKKAIYNKVYRKTTFYLPLTLHLTEEEIKDAFVKTMNRYIGEKDEILANMRIAKKAVTNTAELQKS
jgi:hypothetical protein